MVIAIDIFRNNFFIKSTKIKPDDDLKCNYTNWREVLEQQIQKEMHTKDFLICSNVELKNDINRLISKREFQSRNIPVIYLDRRSATLGYYFKHLQLENIEENDYVFYAEVGEHNSTGYIYQLDDHLYRLRNRINVSNKGNEGEITEDTFNKLIQDLVEGKTVTRFIIVYEKQYLKFKDKLESEFKENNYEYKFIEWSRNDACEGLLSRGIMDKFPLFDHKLKNHINPVQVKTESNNQVVYRNTKSAINIPNRLSHKDSAFEKKVYEIPMAINKYPSKTSIMGIDLGTTRCSVAVSRNHEIEAVQDNNGNRSFKSFISFDQSKPITGGVAFKRLRDKPEYVVFDVKRMIGKPACQYIERNDLWPFQIRDSENGVEIVTKTNSGKNAFSAIELSAILLTEMKRMATEFQEAYNNGNSIEEAVITVPSFFNEEQREATREAARLSGIKVLDLLEEPAAKIFYYIFIKRQTTSYKPLGDKNILVFNLGGGTLDISIMQVKDEKLNEIGRIGDSHLGGRDFDEVLATYVSTILENKYNTLLENKKKKFKLMNMIENAKFDLSITEKTEVDISEVGEDEWTPIEITRKKFEDLSKGLLTRINNKIRDALLESGIEKIDKVVYVGGGSKMPMILKSLKDMFPKSEHYYGTDSEYATSVGAVIYALQLSQRRN